MKSNNTEILLAARLLAAISQLREYSSNTTVFSRVTANFTLDEAEQQCLGILRSVGALYDACLDVCCPHCNTSDIITPRNTVNPIDLGVQTHNCQNCGEIYSIEYKVS